MNAVNSVFSAVEDIFASHDVLRDGPRISGSWICYASANTTNKLSLLKRLWGSKVAEPMYKKSKAANMAKKDTKFGGEGRYVIVAITAVGSGGGNFQDALATQAPAREIRFFVTRKKNYVVWSLQREAIKASNGDQNAVMEILKRELKKARDKFDIRMSKWFYNNAGGTVGRMSTYSGATLTMAQHSDMAAFEKDNQYGFSSDDGSATSPAGLRNTGGVPVYRTVQSVSRAANTVTFTETLATVPGITTTDYVSWRGDYAQSMHGLKAWNPSSDPSPGESFLGYDRTSDDMQRVSGIRVPASSTFLDTLIDAAAEGQINGLAGDKITCLMNPLDYAKFEKEMGSNAKEYDVEASVGFKAIKINTQIGQITIVSEVWVEQGVGRIVDFDEVYLRTLGDCPDDITDTAGGLLPDFSDDAKQGRIGTYGNITVENPGENIIVTWPS